MSDKGLGRTGQWVVECRRMVRPQGRKGTWMSDGRSELWWGGREKYRRVKAPRRALQCPDDPSHSLAAEGCICQKLGPSYWLQQLSNICSLDLTDESEAGENEMREDFGIIYCRGNYAVAPVPQLLSLASAVSPSVRGARRNARVGLKDKASASVNHGVCFIRRASLGSTALRRRSFSPLCCLVAFLFFLFLFFWPPLHRWNVTVKWAQSTDTDDYLINNAAGITPTPFFPPCPTCTPWGPSALLRLQWTRRWGRCSPPRGRRETFTINM